MPIWARVLVHRQVYETCLGGSIPLESTPF